jgi:hypothetical protein
MDKLVFQFSTSENKLANYASALIRRVNHSPFSHIDLVLPDGNLLGASDQGAGSPCVEGNPQGVAIRPPGYQTFAYRRQMVLQTDRAADVVSLCRSQLGKAFDKSNMLDFLSDKFPGARDWRLDTHWRCSELICWALEAGQFWGPDQLPWPKNRVTPTDLLLICLTDPRWINRDSFWLPVPGLKLDLGEV